MATDAFGLADTPPEIALGLEETTVEIETEEAPKDDAPFEIELEVPEGAPEGETETQETAQEAPGATESDSQVPGTGEPVSDETGGAAPAEQAPDEDPYLTWLKQKPEDVVFAGKWTDPREIEKGYNESREMYRRAVENKKAEEQRAYEAELREAELANILKEAVPYLQEAATREEQFHQFAEQFRQATGEYPQGYMGRPQPKPLGPQDVNAAIEQRLAQERAQMQAQFQQQQEYQATEQAVMSFYADHPEVEPRGPLDNEITDTMQALNEAWANRTGEEVDMADRGSIEVLYEAAQRPALRQVLALKPEYFDSEAGLELARREAALLEGVPDGQTQVRQVPVSQVGSQTGQRKPFAEAAVTGAEAPEQEDENDPWVQIKREHAKSKASASIFEFE